MSKITKEEALEVLVEYLTPTEEPIEELEEAYSIVSKAIQQPTITSEQVREVLQRMITYEINITKRLNPGGVIKVGAMILNDDIEYLSKHISKLEELLKISEDSFVAMNETRLKYKSQLDKIASKLELCKDIEYRHYVNSILEGDKE